MVQLRLEQRGHPIHALHFAHIPLVHSLPPARGNHSPHLPGEQTEPQSCSHMAMATGHARDRAYSRQGSGWQSLWSLQGARETNRSQEPLGRLCLTFPTLPHPTQPGHGRGRLQARPARRVYWVCPAARPNCPLSRGSFFGWSHRPLSRLRCPQCDCWVPAGSPGEGPVFLAACYQRCRPLGTGFLGCSVNDHVYSRRLDSLHLLMGLGGKELALWC